MLLPVTSIICWCARRPLMPEKRERSMGQLSFVVAESEAGWVSVAVSWTSVTLDSCTSVFPTTSVGSLSPLSFVFVTTPVWVAPFASWYVTVRPTSALAPINCWACIMSAIWPSFWTWVNCAVCARNWVESAGLLGSWYFSWATSSFRNVSWSATDLLLPASVVVLLVYSDVPDVVTSKSLLTKPLIGELMRSSRSVAVHVG